MQVNHKDGVKANNSLSNLEIVTPKENTRHAIEGGLKGSYFKNTISKETADNIKEKLLLGCSVREIAESLNVNTGIVSQIKYGRTWKT